MKILAVRLAEVGCFSAPVAIEGLSDGLNVLAGANEVGKSTVLAALRLAFEREYKTAHRDVEALRPYNGGAPLVEVDFALGGATWRLRKRYLAGKSAELRNIDTGHVARGADAERLLGEILATAGGRSSLSLLWAAQKEALTADAPSNEEATGLKRAIASEVAATVGGSEARKVRAAVRKELETYVTAQRAQPKGEYDAALKLRKRLTADLEIAVSRRDAALARLDRLGDLKVREASIGAPTAAADLASVAKQADAALATAQDAIQKQRIAADAVSAAETNLALARTTRDTLLKEIASLEQLTTQALEDQELARDLTTRLADAETRAAEARDARDGARQALAVADRDLKAAVRAERRQDAQLRLTELTSVLEAIDEATQAGLALRARIEAMAVTPDVMRRLRSEHDAIRRLEDRLSAAAPKLTIAYLPDGFGRISADGKPLVEGAHVVERPLTLHIDGIGTLTLAPGASDDATTATEALERHKASLSSLLFEVGATTVDEAEAQLATRATLEREIGEARARLGALTPAGGVAKLRNEIEGLTVVVTSDEASDVRSRADVERDIELLRPAATTAELADETAQRDVFREREAMARHAATSSDRAKRLAELEAAVPPENERAARIEKHSTAVGDAERALHAAVREHAAWRDQVPDGSRLRALETEAARANEAVRAAAHELETLRRSIAALEGELRGDRNDDVEARVAELEGALALATQRVSRMDDEVAALQLLDTELLNEEMQSRDLYLQPITDRLTPMIQVLFPNGDVSVAENFAPAGLRRVGDWEEIAALSEGTQEQLAVMVRLAFGRLMADSGHAVPVILDDALVYSDDERILRMFAALIMASQYHQVIVFTCRSRAFGSLDAHRLAIKPWHIDADQRPALSIAG